jgi:hypothetical protein
VIETQENIIMKQDDAAYTAPQVHSLGSVEAMTEQKHNKVGASTDAFTAATGGEIVGKETPIV